MLLREHHIERFLHSRIFSVVALLLMLALGFVSNIFHPHNHILNITGTAFHASVECSSLAAYAAAMACAVFTAVVMTRLHKHFSFIPGLSSLYASLLFLGTSSIPLFCTTASHAIPAMVAIVCTFILFSCYEDRTSTSRIFLAFAIISACTLFDFSFLPLIALFIVGVIQMRVFSLRAMLAIAFGIITPYWIVLGFGIINISQLSLPQYHGIWNLPIASFAIHSHIVVAALLMLGIVIIALNSLNLIKLKLQLRLYNSFFLIQFLMMLLMVTIDFSRSASYALMVLVCNTIFITQYFTMASLQRRYIPILLIVFVAIASSIISFYR